MKDNYGILRAMFVFFASLPYTFFRIGYFVTTIPRRIRHIRRFRIEQKDIVYERLSQHRMSVLEMVECIHKLRLRHGQGDVPPSPSMGSLLQALWDEEMSSHWKIPMVSEVQSIRADLFSNMRASRIDATKYLIWAIADDSHMFVAFDLETGEYRNATPSTPLVLLRGKAPDSAHLCFAYAVSVTLRGGEEYKK